jgi:hypothetical protein
LGGGAATTAYIQSVLVLASGEKELDEKNNLMENKSDVQNKRILPIIPCSLVLPTGRIEQLSDDNKTF